MRQEPFLLDSSILCGTPKILYLMSTAERCSDYVCGSGCFFFCAYRLLYVPFSIQTLIKLISSRVIFCVFLSHSVYLDARGVCQDLVFFPSPPSPHVLFSGETQLSRLNDVWFRAESPTSAPRHWSEYVFGP